MEIVNMRQMELIDLKKLRHIGVLGCLVFGYNLQFNCFPSIFWERVAIGRGLLEQSTKCRDN